MTTTHRCELMPAAGTLQCYEFKPVTDRMSAFLADELLPLMAGLWPASANQMDGNAKGAAMAFGQLLQGFAPIQIREAVMVLAADDERQFAPRPAELRKACQDLARPDAGTAKVVPTVSIRALQMQAEARVAVGELSASALDGYVDQLVAQVICAGHQVTGMEVWHGR